MKISIIMESNQVITDVQMSNLKINTIFQFTPKPKTIEEILTNKNLATLGDAYTNLLYSLCLSIKKKKPSGAKVDSNVLSKALKQARLRNLMPSRVDRHKQADAAEALLVYVWLQGLITITTSVEILTKYPNIIEGFSKLLQEAKKKLSF